MRTKEQDEKVALLKAGQVVEINGLMFSAKEWFGDEGEWPCTLCSFNKSCHLGNADFMAICNGLDLTNDSVWYLHLESKPKIL